jgi:hypothetical protein
MGYGVDTRFYGEFYGHTHSQTPYCVTEFKETTLPTSTLEALYNTTAEQDVQFNTTLSIAGNVTETAVTEQNTTYGSN